MQQERIKALLAEASSPECDWQRVNDIQVELCDSAVGLNENREDATVGLRAARLVVGSLFAGAAINQRGALPGLLPVFSLICGDREEGRLTADIEWSLVDTPPQV